jgi:SNF2 family DNA or RNA helicase
MEFKPHEYQQYAIDYILQKPISAILLSMGLGKTVITLSAIFDLMLDSFFVRRTLIIAPLRVARFTWPDEIAKWDHLHGLTYSVVTGSAKQRKAALMRKAHIYIINRENVEWLVSKSGIPFNYDMLAALFA